MSQGLSEWKIKKQFLYQLPPQDFNPTKRDSEDDEFKANELDLFRTIVKETAVGLAHTNLLSQNENEEMVIFEFLFKNFVENKSDIVTHFFF